MACQMNVPQLQGNSNSNSLVWHNLHGVHKLLFVLSCSSQQTYKEQSLPNSTETLQAEGLQGCSSVYCLRCTGQPAAIHTWRLLECSTPTLSAPAQGACGIPHTPSKDLPKSLVPWEIALDSEWEDPVCWIKTSLPTFPVSLSQLPYTMSIYCRLAPGHSSQFSLAGFHGSRATISLTSEPN